MNRYLVQPPWKVLGFLSVLLLLVTFAVACGDDDDSDDDDAGTPMSDVAGTSSDVCDSAADLETALSDVTQLTTSSTIDQVTQIQSEIKDAVDSLLEAGDSISSDQVTALENAQANLDLAIDDLSGGATIGNAATVLSDRAEEVLTEVDAAKSEAGC